MLYVVVWDVIWYGLCSEVCDCVWDVLRSARFAMCGV